LMAITCGVSLMERLQNSAKYTFTAEVPVSMSIGITRGVPAELHIGKAGEYQEVRFLLFRPLSYSST
jgi:hypothetical protein